MDGGDAGIVGNDPSATAIRSQTGTARNQGTIAAKGRSYIASFRGESGTTGGFNPENQTLKVTVCELPNEASALDRAWAFLVEHARSAGSDLVVLPEMPFHRWLAHTGPSIPIRGTSTRKPAGSVHRDAGCLRSRCGVVAWGSAPDRRRAPKCWSRANAISGKRPRRPRSTPAREEQTVQPQRSPLRVTAVTEAM